MTPDPRPFIRGLHRELVAQHENDPDFQTAGGSKSYVDGAAAMLLVGMDEGKAIMTAYDATTRVALSTLATSLAQAGVDQLELDTAKQFFPDAWKGEGKAFEQPFERCQAVTRAAEQFIALIRKYPNASSDAKVASSVALLYQADGTFRRDWLAATQQVTTGLDVARRGETALSEVALGAYLKELYPRRQGLVLENLRLLPGAHSREVYFFNLLDDSGRNDALVLRRDRAQNVTPASVADERPIMQALRERGFPVPEIVAASDDSSLIGRPFLIMRRIEGRELAQVAQSDPLPYLQNTATLLAELHRSPVEGLSFPLELITPPWEPAWAQLIETTYATWLERRPAPSLTMARAYGWLKDHAHCASAHVSFVHGDYKPANMLVADGCVTGLLDFEISHVGNPAEDLISFRHSAESYIPWNAFF